MAITLRGTDKLISVSLAHASNGRVTRHQGQRAADGIRAHDGPNLGAELSLPTPGWGSVV